MTINASDIHTRNLPPIPEYTGTEENQTELLVYLIHAGQQAPSWYNCQPWELKREGNEILVFLNPDIDHTPFDWNNFNSLLACGAVVENITVAAAARGLSCTVIEFPDDNYSYLVAKLCVDFPGSIIPSSKLKQLKTLEQAVWLRHTNTLMYDSFECEESEFEKLSNSIADYKDCKVNFVKSSAEKNRIFDAVIGVEEIRFSRSDLHKQLYRFIRWSNREAKLTKTGYSLPSMGLCGFGKLFFRLIKPWFVMRLANKLLGASIGFSRKASEGLQYCSAIGLLTVKGNDRQQLLQAGRALEKVWLTVSSMGLDLQPHNTVATFSWGLQHAEHDLFNSDETSRIRRSLRKIADVFKQVDFTKEKVVFLFRIGNGKPVSGFTLRCEPDV